MGIIKAIVGTIAAAIIILLLLIAVPNFIKGCQQGTQQRLDRQTQGVTERR